MTTKDEKKIESSQKDDVSRETAKEKDDIYNDFTYTDQFADEDFGFLGSYDEPEIKDEMLLPENTAKSAISCGFLGVGGGGGKIAKAFLDIGFNKTVLINTTHKDQPASLDKRHFLLLEGADGVGKDVELGKKILSDNSTAVEDCLSTRFGKVDWVFVIVGGGGGTGSAAGILHDPIERYMKSVGSSGRVVYIVSKPTAKELLNSTIESNYESILEDVSEYPHLIIDNERQVQLLRGRVGMLNMYPVANTTFAKLLSQVLSLASQPSPIQTFDTKDLERCLRKDGRIFIGSTVVKNPNNRDLGTIVFQGSMKGSPCPSPTPGSKNGVLLLIVTSEMASNPDVSKSLESAMSYVGGRTETLFSGVYINEKIPGLIGITLFSGM